MRLLLAVLLCFGLLVVGSGCSSWQAMNPAASGVPSDDVLPTRVRVHLRNYTVFVVREPTIVGDSLFGIREVSPEVSSAMLFNESSRESCAIDLKQVRFIEARKPDTLGTVVLLTPVAVVVGLAIWFFVAVASTSY